MQEQPLRFSLKSLVNLYTSIYFYDFFLLTFYMSKASTQKLDYLENFYNIRDEQNFVKVLIFKVLKKKSVFYITKQF